MTLQKSILLFSILAVLAGACAPAPAPASEVAQTEAQTATEYYSLDTVTQIEELDLILRAVASGDPQALVDLFGYTRIPCMTVINALGGPPQCRAGEADGTTVDVLPVLSVEGTFIHADEADKFQGLNVKGIHSIFRNSSTAYSEEYFPVGEYTILFVSDENLVGVALRIGAGKIVRVDYLLQDSAIQTIVTRDALTFILEPK